MSASVRKKLNDTYPLCYSTVGSQMWERICTSLNENMKPQTFPQILLSLTYKLNIPSFLPELARLEWTKSCIPDLETESRDNLEKIQVNPTLTLQHFSWKNLAALNNHKKDFLPQQGEEAVLIWRNPITHDVRVQAATDEDLLVLKVVMEQIDPFQLAQEQQIAVESIDKAIDNSVKKGIILKPSSRIRRDTLPFSEKKNIPERFSSASVFTLQWHITHTCDLHCKHCYDRSKRSLLTFEQGIKILKDFRSFCQKRFVKGHISFTGGNPLLYAHFFDLYRAASDCGFSLSILGNPTSNEVLKKIVDIRRPLFYQVSLEGLQEYNDFIRGNNHFQRVMDFLPLLRQQRISPEVMLTLTKDNMDQIIPLAKKLNGLVDAFNFNRLSPTGEGASLQLPEPESYTQFLKTYVDEAQKMPHLYLKDNLLNIVLKERGDDFFGGCTGFGCGAAFNFVAILPDGQVHACRKFPSLIGNILDQNLNDIYESEIAYSYRAGCSACHGCSMRHVCGGCLAIASGLKLNPFKERDPFCFCSE